MCPAWCSLTGIVPLASARMSLNEFNASAKVAREGPFDRNVEQPLVFFTDFGISRGGRAHVARMVLFDRDSCPGRMTGVSRVHRAVT